MRDGNRLNETFRPSRTTLLRVSEESRIPLIGAIPFGLIDRGTNVVQVRPSSMCPLSCIFCSTDAGPNSRTRLAEYLVDLDYMVSYFEGLVDFKGIDDIEAHIDTVGDPLTYPYLTELIRRLRQNPRVKVISMQTHGHLLTEDKIYEMEEAGLDRVNLSIDSLDLERARFLSGSPFYNVERVKELAKTIVEGTSMDLLIAPVWVPGVNDEDMPKLIEFVLSIGAGKRFPPLGIQKYIPHRLGRRPKGVKPMGWKRFYSVLERWESEFGIKLILSPEDFGTHQAPKLPNVMKIGQVVRAKIVGPGWRTGEALAVAKNRVIMILNATSLPLGSEVRVRVVRDKDNIYVGKLV